MKELREYDQHRFRGLHPEILSGSHLTARRVSDDCTRIIINVPITTLREDGDRIAFQLQPVDNPTNEWYLRQWQVYATKYGAEIILERDHFPAELWDEFVSYAERQSDIQVKWNYKKTTNYINPNWK